MIVGRLHCANALAMATTRRTFFQLNRTPVVALILRQLVRARCWRLLALPYLIDHTATTVTDLPESRTVLRQEWRAVQAALDRRSRRALTRAIRTAPQQRRLIFFRLDQASTRTQFATCDSLRRSISASPASHVDDREGLRARPTNIFDLSWLRSLLFEKTRGSSRSLSVNGGPHGLRQL